MLEIRDLRAGYGQVQVLHGVDLDVGEGEIVALLGSNGAGKSTLNNNVSGIFRPFGGSIRLGGEDVTAAASERMVDLGVIQVPEGRRIFPNMTVRENLELGGYRRAKARRADNLARVVEVFPRLAERFGQIAGTLSGGEQQMLAIGRGLMAQPRVLMLDEPTEGLAPIYVQKVFDLIVGLRDEGMTILMVEQNVQHVLRIADRAYVLENGRIIMEDTGPKLLENPKLKAAYLGL